MFRAQAWFAMARRHEGRLAAPFVRLAWNRADYFRPASLRSSSALSVFSHEKAVALTVLPLPST